MIAGDEWGTELELEGFNRLFKKINIILYEQYNKTEKGTFRPLNEFK